MQTTQFSDIYLDNNATTPVLEVAAVAAQNAMRSMYGNPSSTHVSGLQARYILDSSRETAKQAIGAGDGKLIFLSGATEGIQTAIFSALCQIKQQLSQAKPDQFKYLLYGATEHKAVPNSLNHWNTILEINAEVIAIPVDTNGKLDHDFIQQYIAQSGMICTMAVNNETGVAQDLKALESVIRDNNPQVLWMVDSVQALGKSELKLSQTSIDYAPFSGHKLYAPKGIGMLYVSPSAPFTPFIAGGGQEQGLRSGTENLPGVAAFGAILKALLNPEDDLFKDHQTLVGYRDKLITTLKQAFPGIVFNMPLETSVPTTINFSVKDFPSKEILDLFDAAQIRVSSGSACSSGVTRSYVLDAMGLPAWQSESAIRLSFGPAVSTEEIDEACERILIASQALSQSCLLWSNSAQELTSPQQEGLIQLKKGASCIWLYADQASKTCVIIDPVEELAERIEKFVLCQNFKIQAIIDTHSHGDHESCRPMLQQILSEHMCLSLEHYDDLGWPKKNTTTLCLDDQQHVEAIQLGNDLVLAQLATPGHTADSHSYLLGNRHQQNLKADDCQFAFIGDTLLIGGLGRTNFASSSAEQLFTSIQRLNQVISPNTVLCPAHDYNNEFSTTLAAEIQQNSLLYSLLTQKINQAEFIAEKQNLDKKLDNQVGHEILCGVVSSQCEQQGINVEPSELQSFINSHPNLRVLDVREAHEFHLFDHWQKLNLVNKPENVPLSKLTSFIGESLHNNDSQQELLFVCRSGSRSGCVAETFRRLGFTNACHISGGVALNC
jgi:cysteine desulfurase